MCTVSRAARRVKRANTDSPFPTRRFGARVTDAFTLLAWLGVLLLGVTLIGQILDRDAARTQYQTALRHRMLSTGRDAR